MLEATIIATNRLGLHARAAAKLVRLANTFKSSVSIKRCDTLVHANAKSILSVLNLAAACGVELSVTAAGEDEAAALAAVEELFAGKFGEE